MNNKNNGSRYCNNLLWGGPDGAGVWELGSGERSLKILQKNPGDFRRGEVHKGTVKRVVSNNNEIQFRCFGESPFGNFGI